MESSYYESKGYVDLPDSFTTSDSILTGGYLAGSLAIMTDAAHMLSDFAGFLISLFAIWLGSRPSSNSMSFGWHRAGRLPLLDA